MQKNPELVTVGFVDSPYLDRKDCPANGWAVSTLSEIIIEPKFINALCGLKLGDFIHVIWLFSDTDRNVLKQSPNKKEEEIGVFSMRSPERPNPIALSLCEIVHLSSNSISVKGLECIKNSRVIDIKKAVNYHGIIL